MKMIMITQTTARSLDMSRFLVIFCLTTLSLSLISLANVWGHQCRFYTPDKRNLCLAQQENARFYCKYIKDADQQRYCFAYVDRTPNQCDSITEDTLKTQCSTEAQMRFDEAETRRKIAEENRKAAEARKAAAEEAANQRKQASSKGQGGGR